MLSLLEMHFTCPDKIRDLENNESFRRAPSPYPTDRPWVSEDEDKNALLPLGATEPFVNIYKTCRKLNWSIFFFQDNYVILLNAMSSSITSGLEHRQR